MPWVVFAVALLAAYVLQTAVLGLFDIRALDLFLVLTLVFGFKAPAADARLAGWIAGFAQDLGSTGPLGIHAVALGLGGMVLTGLRELANQDRWWVRWIVGALVAVVPQLVIWLYRRYVEPLVVAGGGGGVSFWSSVLSILWTAGVSAFVAALLIQLPWFVAWRGRRFRAPAYRR